MHPTPGDLMDIQSMNFPALLKGYDGNANTERIYNSPPTDSSFLA
jgi:hypothetical protein